MPESNHDPSSNIITLNLPSRLTLSLPTSPSSAAQPMQLELGFGGVRRITFVITDKIHGATFLRSLHDSRPVTLFDLRFAPHFEFTAVSAKAVDVTLKSLGIHYIQRSVAFHDLHVNILRHDPGQLAAELLTLAYGTTPARGPVMVLVQHMSDAEVFRPYFTHVLERLEGASWTVTFVK
jgi:hypothetical protein